MAYAYNVYYVNLLILRGHLHRILKRPRVAFVCAS